MNNRLRIIEYQEYLSNLYQEKQFDLKHSVKSISFIVTEDCSMRCSYCYQHEKRPNKMTFDVAKEFIDCLLSGEKGFDQYIDSKNCLGCTLEFIGGEPFLEVELMDQIVDYFRQQTFLLQHPWALNFRVSLTSNGLAYFEPAVQNFIKKNADVLSLSITVDGDKELHDSCRIDKYGQPTYDRAMAAVNHYVDVHKGLRNSKLTIAPGNVQFLSNAVINMIHNNYKDIFLNCVYEEGWQPYHAKILYDELKKISDYLIEHDLEEEIYLSILDNTFGHSLQEEDLGKWCGGTGLMIALDWKGNIYPCIRYAENSICGKQEPYLIGNIKDGIGIRPEDLKRIECMNCIDRRTQCTDECFYCPIASGCGECSAYNYEIFGTPDKKATFICIMHKARVLAISYFWNSRHKKDSNIPTYALTIPKDWALEIIPEEEFEMLEKLSKG